LSHGRKPSVRSFNNILDAFLAGDNPDLPHPSAAYTAAMRRCVAANDAGRAGGRSRRPVKALEALGGVCGAGGRRRSRSLLQVMQHASILPDPGTLHSAISLIVTGLREEEEAAALQEAMRVMVLLTTKARVAPDDRVWVLLLSTCRQIAAQGGDAAAGVLLQVSGVSSGSLV